MAKTQSFKELIVWQKAKKVAVLVYQLTESFPAVERFGLVDQMRRASVSISSNIAEGYHRNHTKDKKQFLYIAFGSGAELESQIEVAKELFPKYDYDDVEALLSEVMRMPNAIVSKM